MGNQWHQATPLEFNGELRRELLERQERDQQLRRELMEWVQENPPAYPEALAELQVVDEANTVRMKEIVAAFGWPGMSLVGKDGAMAANSMVHSIAL